MAELCARAERYEVLRRLGRGAFGEVTLCRDRSRGQLVACKGIPVSSQAEDLPKAIFRELHSLQQCDHENIVRLLSYFPQAGCLHLVFEFCESDLAKLIDRARQSSRELPLAVVKAALEMLLAALAHLHGRGMIHRDVKPSNLLLTSGGSLKLADFGLARILDPAGPMSPQVATRWYRAPELLYGSDRYDGKVDVWAAGCILAEMLRLSPLFKGTSDIDQLFRVLQGRGTPTADRWPRAMDLPDFGKLSFPPMDPRPMEDLLPTCADAALRRLAGAMLALDPQDRPSAASALADDAFFAPPAPSEEAAIAAMVRGMREGDEAAAPVGGAAESLLQSLAADAEVQRVVLGP